VSSDLVVAAVDGLDLGALIESRAVAGGLSNDLWHVRTDRGQFAVKVMRANADAPDFRANVEAAYDVERRARAHGVPSPEPCPTADGRALLRVQGHWVRAHQWRQGIPPAPGEYLEDAGRLLAAIHAAGASRDEALHDEPWDADGWSSLAGGLSAPLADRLRRAAGTLADLEEITCAPAGSLVTHVDSHGDLDPKNTMVADGTLLALDWDAAGPQPVVREAVAVGLDWSHDVDGFRRVLGAFEAASGHEVPAEPWVFGGWVSALGGWVVFNATTRGRSEIGQAEVTSTLERLLALRRDLDRYVASLGGPTRDGGSGPWGGVESPR
jgi:Ser/Thr protein kinase RdoA (MazF antagonist)